MGFLVYNHVHHDVMALAWDVADYLEGEGESNLPASDVGQEAVVVAFASAKPFAVWCECHAGDDGEVDVGVVGEDRACGL